MIARKDNGTVRIIAGKWRGRLIRFPSEDLLRPTPDRVRETLFNWLRDDIAGARCLDLCAGSGALGIEALSRGANSVDFFDTNKALIKNIAKQITLYDKQAKTVYHNASALVLEKFYHQEQFDIVFIDPPYKSMLQQQLINKLNDLNLVKGNSIIYCESDLKTEINCPENWEIIKSKKFSRVLVQLMRVKVAK